MKKPIELYDSVLNVSVELHFSKEKTMFNATVHKCDAVIAEGVHKGSPYPVYIVTMSDRNDFYVLLHECIHLVKHIFADRHIPFSADNDEVLAYYMEWWFKTLWRVCHKKGK